MENVQFNFRFPLKCRDVPRNVSMCFKKSANYKRSLLIFAYESGQKRNKSCFCGLLDFLVQSIPLKSYRLVQFRKLKIYHLVQLKVVTH